VSNRGNEPIGIACLIAIWAITEYHNAGGWPTQGFSQSSGIHDVWNFCIVYPVGAWLAILATRAWYVYMRKPITERDIEREIDVRSVGRRSPTSSGTAPRSRRPHRRWRADFQAGPCVRPWSAR
jgi:hypothetical protein